MAPLSTLEALPLEVLAEIAFYLTPRIQPATTYWARAYIDWKKAYDDVCMLAASSRHLYESIGTYRFFHVGLYTPWMARRFLELVIREPPLACHVVRLSMVYHHDDPRIEQPRMEKLLGEDRKRVHAVAADINALLIPMLAESRVHRLQDQGRELVRYEQTVMQSVWNAVLACCTHVRVLRLLWAPNSSRERIADVSPSLFINKSRYPLEYLSVPNIPGLRVSGAGANVDDIEVVGQGGQFPHLPKLQRLDLWNMEWGAREPHPLEFQTTPVLEHVRYARIRDHAIDTRMLIDALGKLPNLETLDVTSMSLQLGLGGRETLLNAALAKLAPTLRTIRMCIPLCGLHPARTKSATVDFSSLNRLESLTLEVGPLSKWFYFVSRDLDIPIPETARSQIGALLPPSLRHLSISAISLDGVCWREGENEYSPSHSRNEEMESLVSAVVEASGHPDSHLRLQTMNVVVNPHVDDPHIPPWDAWIGGLADIRRIAGHKGLDFRYQTISF